MSNEKNLLHRQEITLADSFVAKNKLRTEDNNHKDRPSSGEARLYLGGVNTEAYSLFSFESEITYRNKTYLQSNGVCYFYVPNLLEYFYQARNEYLNPSQNYFYDISKYYFEILDELQSYHSEKLYFRVFHHPGETDGVRFYINSLSPHWTLFRKLALPHITNVIINKFLNKDSNEIEYYFELNLDKRFSKTESILNDSISESQLTALTFEREFSTEKMTMVLARRGQGLYKSLLLETMPTCCFTNLADIVLLRASHIKPWKNCLNQERLDPYNGLILTPTYDVLFDKGLISFYDDGCLLISSLLSPSVIETLSLDKNQSYNIFNDHGLRSPYLKHHREHIFKP